MHLLHQETHDRFDGSKISDRRSYQNREGPAAQIGNVEVASAGRLVHQLIVPSVERRRYVRFERHALLVFPPYVLTKLVDDKLIQIGLRDEESPMTFARLCPRLIIFKADLIVRRPRIVSLSST
jgi:hypothetical protein